MPVILDPDVELRAARLLEAKRVIGPFDAMEMRIDALTRKRARPERKAS